MYDVIVVGAGAMGSAAAWALAGEGRDVLVLEQFARGHHRGGSHGATRLFRLVYREADYVQLAQRALAAWRTLEAEGGNALLDTTGSVEHGLRPSELTAVTSVMAQHRVPFSVLEQTDASQRWPGMRFETEALYQPDGGRLRADRAIDEQCLKPVVEAGWDVPSR